TTVELHRLDRTTHKLTLTSRAEKKRALLVRLCGEGYAITSGAPEDVRSPGEPRYARLTLEPKEKKTTEVVEEGKFVERVAIDQLTSVRISNLLAAKQLSPDVRATLTALKAELTRSEVAAARLEKIDARLKQLETDGARLRDGLTAAGKGGAQ